LRVIRAAQGVGPDGEARIVLAGEHTLAAQLTLEILGLGPDGRRLVRFLDVTVPPPPGPPPGPPNPGPGGGGPLQIPVVIGNEDDGRFLIRQELPPRGNVESLSYSDLVVSELASVVYAYFLQPQSLVGSPPPRYWTSL
jgi:hypothetical protein